MPNGRFVLLDLVSLFVGVLVPSGYAREVSPEPLEVELTDGRSGKCFELPWSDDGVLLPYKCFFGGHEALLVRNGTNSEWFGLGTTKRLNSATYLPVKTVRQGGTILFGAAVPRQQQQQVQGRTVGRRGAHPDPSPNFREENQSIEELLLTIDTMKQIDPGVFAVPEVGRVLTPLLETTLKRQTEIRTAIENRDVAEVELMNGQKLKCASGKDAKTAQESTPDFRGSRRSCALWACDPLTIDGKTYTPLLHHDPRLHVNGTGTLVLANEEGLGPRPYIRSISLRVGESFQTEWAESEELPEFAWSEGTRSARLNRGGGSWYFLQDEYGDTRLREASSDCENTSALKNALSLVERGREKMEDAMVRRRTVQFFDLLDAQSEPGYQPAPGEKRLYSWMIEKKQLPDDACRMNRRVYSSELAKEKVEEAISLNSKPTEFALSEAEANALFKEIAAMDDIPFRYADEGCHARAHVIAHRLRERGIDSEKVWAHGRLELKSSRVPWRMHVAPVIAVRMKNGKIERRVMDPSVGSRPQTVSEWLGRFSPGGKRQWVEGVFPPAVNAQSRAKIMVSFTRPEVYVDRLETTRDPVTVDWAIQTNQRYLQELAARDAEAAKKPKTESKDQPSPGP